jgi:arylsulfatase
MSNHNILFIVADQLRFDTALDPAAAPFLANLASTGIIATRCYANSAECIPSRFSFMTGHYPRELGVETNMQVSLAPNADSWVRNLKQSGYKTGIVGKSHLHPHIGDIRDRRPLMQKLGFDWINETTGPRASASVLSDMTELWEQHGVWESYRRDLADRLATKPFMSRPTPLPLKLFYDCYIGSKAKEFLLKAQGESPWFLFVGFAGPHEPWDAPIEYLEKLKGYRPPQPLDFPAAYQNPATLAGQQMRVPFFAPDLTLVDIEALRLNYAAKVRLIDDQIKSCINQLHLSGQLDKTTIVVTSDHGEMNGDHGLIYKSNFFEQSIKVPLIISRPVDRKSNTNNEIKILIELRSIGDILNFCIDHNLENKFSFCKEFEIKFRRNFIVTQFSSYSCLIAEEWKLEIDRDGKIIQYTNLRLDPNEILSQSYEGSHELNKLINDFRLMHFNNKKEQVILS